MHCRVVRLEVDCEVGEGYVSEWKRGGQWLHCRVVRLGGTARWERAMLLLDG